MIGGLRSAVPMKPMKPPMTEDEQEIRRDRSCAPCMISENQRAAGPTAPTIIPTNPAVRPVSEFIVNFGCLGAVRRRGSDAVREARRNRRAGRFAARRTAALGQ